MEAIENAFEIQDPEQLGEIDIETMKENFHAENHPDVISGRQTAEDIRDEFLDSFEEFCRYLREHSRHGKISKDDFIEYYSHFNICVVNDEEFADILIKSWKPVVVHKPMPYRVKEETKAPVYDYSRQHVRRGAANISSIDNTLQLGAKLYNKVQGNKREQIKSPSIANVLEDIRRDLLKRGIRKILGLLREFKVYLCIKLEYR